MPNISSGDDAFVVRVKRLVANGPLRDCLFLVKNGVPYDVAFSLADDMRLAYVILLGEQAGGVKWDWANMEFVPIQAP